MAGRGAVRLETYDQSRWTKLLEFITAAATVAALFFAWRAVAETRKLRREDRLARLPELVADVGAVMMAVSRGTAVAERDTKYPIARVRLEAALAATGEELPRCRELARRDRTLQIGEPPHHQIMDELEAALEELADRLRPPPSTPAEPVASEGGGDPPR